MNVEFDMKCETCPCFAPIQGPMGACHRFPPQVILMPGQVMAAGQQPHVNATFPPTHKDAHCFEYAQMSALASTLRRIKTDQENARPLSEGNKVIN